jgi:hypothetical protein
LACAVTVFGEHTRPRVFRLAPRQSEGLRLNKPNGCVREWTKCSARARNTAREARALPIRLNRYGLAERGPTLERSAPKCVHWSGVKGEPSLKVMRSTL